MMYGRARWQEAEATRKDFNTVLIHQDKKPSTTELFKVIQEAIPLIRHYRTMLLVPNNFFEYIFHTGCAINLHSIMNSGLMAGGQNLSNRHTVFLTVVNPTNKNHKDPQEIDLTKPRLALYKQVEKAPGYGVDIKPAQKKGFLVLSNKIERNHPQRYTPSLLYLESSCDEI